VPSRSHEALKTAACSFRIPTEFEYTQNYLPRDVVDPLDLTSLELHKESFIDEELREHQSDLLCRVRQTNGEDAFLYLLLEHKSYPDQWVALQLLRYKLRTWDQLRTGSEKLSPILPVVLYHGTSSWNAPRSLVELVHTPDLWRRYVADFEYLFFDLSRMQDSSFTGRAPLIAALLILKHIFASDLEIQFVRIVRLLWEGLDRQIALTYLEVIVRYATASGKMNEQSVKRTLRQAVSEGEKTLATWIDKYIEQGLQQGLQQGVQQAADIAYRQLMLVLRHRFVEISPALDAQLRKMNIAEIEYLTNTALEAGSLEEFRKVVDILVNTIPSSDI
jgi:predicted transposase/invertase (TIGR01784 family)